MKKRFAVALLAVVLAAVGGGWKWSSKIGASTASAGDTQAVLVAPAGWSWGDGLPQGWSWGDDASAVPVQLDADVPVDASLEAPTGWGGAAPDGWSWGSGGE
jgi:hypothetical protein